MSQKEATRPLRVFVYEYLSGGGTGADPALLREGQWMRDALAQDLVALGPDVAVTCAGAPGLPGLPAGCTVAFAQPGEPHLAFIAREARRHDWVWAVLPETDDLLGACSAAVAPEQWVGCDTASIRAAASKRGLGRLLAAQGVPSVDASGSDAEPDRWVVKPDDGAGAVGVRVHTRLADAQADQTARPGTVLQPWIDGEAMSLSLLCADGHAELLSINRQHVHVAPDGWLRVDGLELAVLQTRAPAAAAARALAVRVARALPGLRGFAGIDIVWHPQRGPVVIEINPRVTSAWAGLSERLGRPLAREVLALCALGRQRSAGEVCHVV